MEWLRGLPLFQKSSVGGGSGTAAARRKSTEKAIFRSNVVIMGAGRLGQSLLSLPSFSQHGFRVVGVFDSDPRKIGLRLNGVLVESPDAIRTRVKEHGVYRAIIAVPSLAAQQAADQLVQAGIRLILNYAPVNLKLPMDVVCERIDPAQQLTRLSSNSSFVASILTESNMTTSNYSLDDLLQQVDATSFSPLRGVYCSFPFYMEYVLLQKFESRHLASLNEGNEQDLEGDDDTNQGDDGESKESFFVFLQKEKEAGQVDDSVASEFWMNPDSCSTSSGGGVAYLQDYDRSTSTPSPTTIFVEETVREREVVIPRPKSAPIVEHRLDAAVTIDQQWLVKERPAVRFDNLAGLEEPKAVLRESVTYNHGVGGEKTNNHIGNNNNNNNKGFSFSNVLLYGPPGAGKSSLVKALMGEHFQERRFYFVSAADMSNSQHNHLSLENLFQVAAQNKHGKKNNNNDKDPAVIYIDAVDILCKSHIQKLELIKQLEINNVSSQVLVICATNLPWELDISVLRHFERRINVSLPNKFARKKLFVDLIKARTNEAVPETLATKLASLTTNYSPPDIALVVKDALRNNKQLDDVDYVRSINNVKPTISSEIQKLYMAFAQRFGHSSPTFQPGSMPDSPTPPYLSLYC